MVKAQIFIILITSTAVLSEYILKYVSNPSEGHGYDLFNYDGESLRDEKVRYDLLKKDIVFNLRYGFRDSKSNFFYLTQSKSDGNGIFSKTSIVTSEVLEEILRNKVQVPVLRLESDFETSSPKLYETTSNRVFIDCDEDQVDQTDCTPVIRKPIMTRISPQALKSLVG